MWPCFRKSDKYNLFCGQFKRFVFWRHSERCFRGSAPVFSYWENLCVAKAESDKSVQDLWVSPEGGSSSSGSTTMIGNMEWSATGRIGATLSDQNHDVSFAFSRTKSRLTEMSGDLYQTKRPWNTCTLNWPPFFSKLVNGDFSQCLPC